MNLTRNLFQMNLLTVYLCEAQFDSPLLERFGKLLQLFKITGLLHRGGVHPLGGRLTVGQTLNVGGCRRTSWR